MTDQIRREVAERRDAEAEEDTETRLRNMRDEAPGRLAEDISHGQSQHLKNLKKITDEQQKFLREVAKLEEMEKEEHEKKKQELLLRAMQQKEEVAKKCDVVTQAALNNLDVATLKLDAETLQLEKEVIEAKAKSAEIEVDVTKMVFNEVDHRKDKDELQAEKRAESLRDQYASIQKEEEHALQTERAQRKENASMAIAEIRSDLAEQQSMGLFNLAIQHSADDRKNRKQINGKIMEVRGALLEELDRVFLRASEVINSEPDQYQLVKPSKKRATKGLLVRFTEILSSISTKLSEIEQNLASLEMEDVQMNDIIRSIKKQISSFGKVIANLKLTLGLDNVPIDPKKSEEFNNLKEELFNSVNGMELISERRDQIREAILERQIETMPKVEPLSIDN